ncbi:MAG: carboxymuconolactone decarboxylase family protein [Actinobacteria bacterium]|nr:carboxymuconolactone decarboxylase family protein [Actinomycetota bacterium]
MAHVQLLDPASTDGDRRLALDEIQGAFGTVPAMFRAVANSPAALRSMWGSFGALGGGALTPVLGEQIAVAVADRNRCEYCLAAHTALGRKAGADGAAMAAAQAGESADPRTAAVLAFALQLVDTRGSVPAGAIETVRAASLSDEEIVEVIAHVALNLFTNYVNVSLAVPVDFPSVPLTPAP